MAWLYYKNKDTITTKKNQFEDGYTISILGIVLHSYKEVKCKIGLQINEEQPSIKTEQRIGKKRIVGCLILAFISRCQGTRKKGTEIVTRVVPVTVTERVTGEMTKM